VQDALVRALSTWPFSGVPAEPLGWLFLVARNRALDLLRREASLRGKLDGLGDASVAPPPFVQTPALGAGAPISRAPAHEVRTTRSTMTQSFQTPSSWPCSL
jgi:DNA-directed RNA polymerase specialized sigma24 family protein